VSRPKRLQPRPCSLALETQGTQRHLQPMLCHLQRMQRLPARRSQAFLQPRRSALRKPSASRHVAARKLQPLNRAQRERPQSPQVRLLLQRS